MPLRIRKTGIEAGTISWSMVIWLGIAAISFWHLFAVRLDGEMDKYVIGSDGSGYYAYLPATFIYQDFSYSFADPYAKGHLNYYGNNRSKFVARNKDGKLNNKYFIGTSVLMLPFFLLAWLFSWIFDYPIDGYSFLFQSFMAIAGVFYLLAGLHYLRKLLLRAKIKDGIAGATISVIFLATNLYHYALEEPTMSHVYSFAAISFFLYHAFVFMENGSKKNFIAAATAFVLIVAIRPTNGIVLLALPFLYFLSGANENQIRENLRNKTWYSIPSLTAITLLFLQLLCYKLTVGKWTTDSYTGESFNFADPHILDVLFSWRKGLFIYTPVLLLSIAGIFFMRNKKAAIAFAAFFMLNTWVISSWHDWAYGGSLGLRPYIDYFPVFAISLAFFFQFMRNWIAASATAIVCLFFVALNISQHYQYHFGILPYEAMDEYKYKRLFFRHNKVFSGIFPPETWNLGVVPSGCSEYKVFKRNFDNDTLFTNNQFVTKEKISFSPPAAVMLTDTMKISPDIYFPIKGTIPDSLLYRTWVQIKMKVWLTDDECDAKAVVSFFDDNSNYSWNARNLVHRVDETFAWKTYLYAFKVPPPEHGSGKISAYVIKDDKSTLYIDDMEVSLWAEPPSKK